MEVLWGVIQDGGALGCDSGWRCSGVSFRMEVLWGVIQDGGALGCDSGWRCSGV